MLWIFPGSSIQACRATRRHILAVEEDKEIFDGLIAPAMQSIVVPKPAPMQLTVGPIDLDDEKVVFERIAKTSKLSK